MTLFGCSVYYPHIRHAQLHKLSPATPTRLRGQWLIEDDLTKRSTKHTNKSTLVVRGANTQLGLGSSCVLTPLATNVDLWNPIEVEACSRVECVNDGTNQHGFYKRCSVLGF